MPRMRGAIPTPRHKLARAMPFRPYRAVPASFGYVPKTLNMWGNDTFGDCVSAEEAFAKAAYSAMLGLPETFIPEATVESWCRSHGYLNGADLTDVMTTMASTGMVASDGKTYTDGGYAAVDYTSWAALTAAICEGPVKIGVAAGQLEGSVGSTNGWIGTGWHRGLDQDHCTGLCGYGTFEQCFQMLGMPVPSDHTGGQWFLFFTWSTIGVVDFASAVNIMGEAWLRSPTTVGLAPFVPPVVVPIPSDPQILVPVDWVHKQIWAPSTGWSIANP